ncbi:MAG TPA: DMT family transporter [Thermoanaerobaculia bacterium]
MSSAERSHRLLARIALLGATGVWATSFVIVQRALVVIPVFHLLAYRFTLATLLLLPLARGARWTPQLRRDGAAIGLSLFAGFALQTSALLWTTPARTAFLTGLSVVFVPLMGLVLGRRLRAGPALGSLIAAVGLYVLYLPAAGGAGQAGIAPAGFGKGDVLALACAVAFAVYVLLVERAARRNPVAPLALVEFGLVALLALPTLAFPPPAAGEFRGFPLFATLVLAVLATAAAFVAQLYGQRHLSAIEAGVIFTLEPVLAAGLSVALKIDPPSRWLAIGGALVVAAMLVTELWGGPDDAPPAVGATPRS